MVVAPAPLPRNAIALGDPRFYDLNRERKWEPAEAIGEAVGGRDRGDGKRASLQRLPALQSTRRCRTNHLGLPINAAAGRQRYRYARTYTIVYDPESEGNFQTEKQWQLLQDTRKVMDLSSTGLWVRCDPSASPACADAHPLLMHRTMCSLPSAHIALGCCTAQKLFQIFSVAAKSIEQSLVGQRTFRLVLAKCGIRDVILMQRLFSEFKQATYPERICYRAFLRTLASVSGAAVEEKLGFLFDVWDADGSASLTYGELAPILLAALPVQDVEEMSDRFSGVWAQLRESIAGGAGEKEWIGLSRASAGITKSDLLDACRKLPAVRDFFHRVLTRQAPKAEDRSMHSLGFAARLRELEAEVAKETRSGSQQPHVQQALPIGHTCCMGGIGQARGKGAAMKEESRYGRFSISGRRERVSLK